MRTYRFLIVVLAASLFGIALTAAAFATDFNVPAGDLKTALDAYVTQAGAQLAVSADAVRGARTRGVRGNLSDDDALSKILAGTGFVVHHHGGSMAIVRDDESSNDVSVQFAQAAPVRAAVETVTVTSSKLGGADVQSIPISITALSQEQLTATQTAGGPDLVKQVPNLTFTKTNFTGYSIQIRGIGTQAISVTTDPAVAVALNDTPFIRNHFFEQEFYDLGQAEVLRGPQGTLYGRNATAGVVNLITAKPTDQFEAMASGELGNYHQRRFEGMINLPIVDDRLDIRIAGEWTKRQGYSFNSLTDSRIDGRDLWSGRVTIGWKPVENLQAYLVWEHFSEDDDRMRTAKQLCKTAHPPTEVGGVPVPTPESLIGQGGNGVLQPTRYLDQGCLPTSLYSADAFQVPDGLTLPYYAALGQLGVPLWGGDYLGIDPYASTTQSRNLRVIESSLNPVYKAKNDTVELNADYKVTPALTLTSQTGFNHDFLWSTEDYNRFNTTPGAFEYTTPGDGDELDPNSLGQLSPDPNGLGRCRNQLFDGCQSLPSIAQCTPPSGAYVNTGLGHDGNGYSCVPDGVFCDPQLGCSDRLVAEDLSDEHAWQLSQEFRFASNFSGPLNFSAGGNYLHYETEENYYVFINTITLTSASPIGGHAISPWVPGVSDNSDCLIGGFVNSNPFIPQNPQLDSCPYIDPNPITKSQQ